jgi:ferritin-like metal-binding protein YciE
MVACGVWLDESEARERLQETLNEEGAADHRLSEIAEDSVNVRSPDDS